MAAVQPSLAPLPFLRNSKAPDNMWKKCMELLRNWSSMEGKYSKHITSFRKKMVIKTLCDTNVLEDTLPENVTPSDAEEQLTKAYETKRLSKVSANNVIYTNFTLLSS